MMFSPAVLKRVEREQKVISSDHAAGFLEGVKSVVWDRQTVRSIEAPSENCEEHSVTATIEVETNWSKPHCTHAPVSEVFVSTATRPTPL
jgi:hypothetical protein